MTDKIKNKIEQLLNQKIEELKKSYQKHIENDEDEEFNDDYWYLSPIGDNEVKSINSVNVVDVKIVKLDRFKSLGFPDEETQLQVKVTANVNNNVDEFDEIIPELESALEIFADSVRIDFNQIIKEQKRRINEVNDETIQKVATNWFKRQISRGEDPHISGDLLMFLNIKPHRREYPTLLETLRSFLGDSVETVIQNKVNKVYNTIDYPNISGGYDFKFKISIEEIEGDQVILNVELIPGGEVTLIMQDGETVSLVQAMWDEEIGDEVSMEVDDVINGILYEEIPNYTGYSFVINHTDY